MGWLTDPLADPTTRRALLELALLGIAGGALGCWVVLQGLAYGAESLAHATLPGLVLAALAGAPLLLGAAGGLALAAGAVVLVARAPGVGRDTAIAVVVTTLLGLGVLLALSPRTPAGLGALLFGDVLAVADGDLVAAAVLAAVTVAALAVAHPLLLAAGFDRAGARRLGRPPLAADAVLAALLAATLLVAVPALGTLLVVALLAGPAVAARGLARRMGPMLAAAAATAVAAAALGLWVSFHLETAAGATVAGALVLGALLGVSGSRRSARAA